MAGYGVVVSPGRCVAAHHDALEPWFCSAACHSARQSSMARWTAQDELAAHVEMDEESPPLLVVRSRKLGWIGAQIPHAILGLLMSEGPVGRPVHCPAGSPLREPLDRTLLEITGNSDGDRRVERYLGSDD